MTRTRRNPPAPARRTDPSTSREAGVAMADSAAAMRVRVLNIYEEYKTLAHFELYAIWRQRYGRMYEGSVRPRCGELMREGCLRNSGLKKPSPKSVRGRAVRVVVWEWVPPDERAAEKARWWANFLAKRAGNGTR